MYCPGQYSAPRQGQCIMARDDFGDSVQVIGWVVKIQSEVHKGGASADGEDSALMPRRGCIWVVRGRLVDAGIQSNAVLAAAKWRCGPTDWDREILHLSIHVFRTIATGQVQFVAVDSGIWKATVSYNVEL